MIDQREHILALTPGELIERLTALGMPKFRAQQIHEWIFQKRAASFEQMTNLSKSDRALLAEKFDIFTSQIVRNLTSPDATQKILLEWPPAPIENRKSKIENPPAPSLTECVMIPSR